VARRDVAGGNLGGPAPLALAVYGALSLLAVGAAAVRGKNPLEAEAPWLDLDAWAHAGSLAGGVVLALVTIQASRFFVKQWGWARMLHADLRPSIRHAGDGTLLVLGLTSGIGEELFFRGLLTPALGLVLSSVAFGAVHQLRGRTGWIWSCWAGVMGFLFGALFLLTGSLLGPIVAHAAINVMNLRFLRDTDVEQKKPRRLGGLLGRA
jgi:membrane protease YdiL (CAAX protease family)